MKKYFKYLYTHIFTILTFLIVSFFSPIVIIDIINNNTAYYEASFSVSNIEEFNHELLLDEQFLNEIKNSASKYENINVEKMLEKGHLSYVIDSNNITITTKIKYYDNFFNSSSKTVGTRAKTFIKDSVLSIASDKVDVIFENEKDIVTKQNYISNSLSIALITLASALVIELILSIIFFKLNLRYKKEKFIYNNETMFRHCFSKKYWKLSTKPLVKVKDMTMLAMLFALMMACKFVPIPSGFGNLGLGLTYLFFAITAMVYGPVYGFVVGVFSDIIGFFISDSSGIFHLGYTLQAALTGFIYGLCFYKTRISFSKVFLSRLIVNLVINVLYVFFINSSAIFLALFTSS